MTSKIALSMGRELYHLAYRLRPDLYRPRWQFDQFKTVLNAKNLFGVRSFNTEDKKEKMLEKILSHRVETALPFITDPHGKKFIQDIDRLAENMLLAQDMRVQEGIKEKKQSNEPLNNISFLKQDFEKLSREIKELTAVIRELSSELKKQQEETIHVAK